MKRRFILFIAAVFVFTAGSAQEWSVPPDKEKQLSPFGFDKASQDAGADLYRLNCLSCHGTPGRGNYAALVPSPGDPSSDKHQNNSDGSLFYKISEGKGLMPAFKNILGARDIWSIISWLRTFKEGYVQQISDAGPAAGAGSEANISFAWNETEGIVEVSVTDKADKPLNNIGVTLFAKRTFGMLPLSDLVVTNSEGKAAFLIEGDLPGDREGNINMIARLAAADGEDPVVADTILKAGMAMTNPGLTEQRAMWNTGKKAPLWLIATYLLGALSVWGFIIYIMLGLRKIWFAGADKNG